MADGRLWQVPPYDPLPAIDVYLVWNPKTAKNRAEEMLLAALRDAIATTPLDDRTYR